ncbi:hypothetical protein [Peptoniphilus catoniae]|nr:hypothetical protein [Peptoniphilus catoniae]
MKERLNYNISKKSNNRNLIRLEEKEMAIEDVFKFFWNDLRNI